jgi:hypothetical protein
MHIESAQSGHWTDEQLIDHWYGVGPEDGHLTQCVSCQARFEAIEARRRSLPLDEPVGENLLAAQRRAIYERLSEPRRWWRELPMRRWSSAAAVAIVLALISIVYQRHEREVADSRTDAALARDVSRMSFESEPPSTAPLEGLFVE